MDILITPAHFFSELCKKEVSLKYPVLIIALISIISGISAYIITGKMMIMMPSGMEGTATVVSLFAFAAALIGTFIYWIIWVVAILVMIHILKGEHTFSRLLEITGYGFIPQILGGVISTGIVITSLPDMVIPATSSAVEMQAAIQAISTSSPMLAASIIGLIFTFWSAYIIVFGVKEASKLELKKAAICTAVPLAIFVLINLSSFLM